MQYVINAAVLPILNCSFRVGKVLKKTFYLKVLYSTTEVAPGQAELGTPLLFHSKVASSPRRYPS